MELLGTGIDGGDADGGLVAAVTSTNQPEESNTLNLVLIGMPPLQRPLDSRTRLL
jgi:hypothetical protein